MPRTRGRRPTETAEKPITTSQLKEAIIAERDAKIEKLNSLVNNAIDKMKLAMVKEMAEIPQKYVGKTLGEISMMDSVSMQSSTCSSKHASKPALRRSLSLVNDEGYLTTDRESNGSTDSTRMSRSKSRTAKKTRVSRSLSTSKAPKYKTPANKAPLPMSTFTVTPKINPHMPLTVLRRPKPGETAISLTGSPLLVGNAMGDFEANVNIPLSDGGQISIQPRRGLRKSQLPELNPNVLTQLQKLRDNISCLLEN